MAEVTRGSQTRPFSCTGAPTSGAAGTFYGNAQIGALLVDETNAIWYVNTGTLASPTWSRVPTTDGAILEDSAVKTVADANILGGIPILFRIDVADASANTDVVVTHKIRVLDAWGLNTGIGAHATADTWQVKNGATAITDAGAKSATVNAIKRISTVDPAAYEIAAAGTLRITAVKSTNAAVTVYVLAIRVA